MMAEDDVFLKHHQGWYRILIGRLEKHQHMQKYQCPKWCTAVGVLDVNMNSRHTYTGLHHKMLQEWAPVRPNAQTKTRTVFLKPVNHCGSAVMICNCKGELVWLLLSDCSFWRTAWFWTSCKRSLWFVLVWCNGFISGDVGSSLRCRAGAKPVHLQTSSLPKSWGWLNTQEM